MWILFILLNILKYIAIALGVILAILLLLFVIVLLSPLSYKVMALKDAKASAASVRVSWLFGIVRFWFKYIDDDTETRFSIFGIKLKCESEDNGDKPQKQKKRKKPEKKEKKSGETSRFNPLNLLSKRSKHSKNEPEEKFGFIKDIIDFPDKKEILRLLILLTKRIFKAIKPRHFYLSGEIGLEEPDKTGLLFALLSIIRVFAGKNIYLTANFHEEVLKIDFKMKGYTNVLKLCLPFLRFVLSKPIRRILKRIREDGKK